jgi:hypothetical protein
LEGRECSAAATSFCMHTVIAFCKKLLANSTQADVITLVTDAPLERLPHL